MTRLEARSSSSIKAQDYLAQKADRVWVNMLFSSIALVGTDKCATSSAQPSTEKLVEICGYITAVRSEPLPTAAATTASATATAGGCLSFAQLDSRRLVEVGALSSQHQQLKKNCCDVNKSFKRLSEMLKRSIRRDPWTHRKQKSVRWLHEFKLCNETSLSHDRSKTFRRNRHLASVLVDKDSKNEPKHATRSFVLSLLRIFFGDKLLWITGMSVYRKTLERFFPVLKVK